MPSVTTNSDDYKVTQYNLLVGDANNLVANVAPSATSGVPIISTGASANPSFSTMTVAGGGTGDTSFTAYSVICGGTTTTGVLQNVSGVGSSTNVLTSNGTSALPTWQAVSGGTGYALSIQTGTGNPLDGSTLFLITQGGINLDVSATDKESSRFFIPVSGTINKCYGAVTVEGVLGTTESSTLNLRLNNTTDTVVTSSLQMNLASNTFSATTLGISVTAGDYIQAKLVCATWATNPTTVSCSLTFFVE
jgi:hypothetical protein